MRPFSLRLFAIVALTSSIAVMSARGDETPAEKTTYDDQARAIFRDHCFSCHNQNQAKSDLALDSFSALMQGGAGGTVVEPGDPEASRLWKLVSHQESPAMPPEQDKLSDEKLAIIKAWITGGALENSGATAKIKARPKFEMKATGGFVRPEGPPPMPEKISRQPVAYSPRKGAVTALACSPWAPLAAVAGVKQVALYHTDSGELLGVLPFPEGIPHILKFSRNGSLLLAGGGRAGQRGMVAVFDVKTGERVFEVGDELDVVLAADINENHTQIALGGPQRVVRVYSTSDGSLVREIRKHTEWITAIEFSPDGVLLATGDRNGGLFTWESETGREYQNLKAHTGTITDVSWRADSLVLASASEDTTIKLWEMENGGNIKNWGAHGGGATSLEFTHDGRIVSTGRDRVTRIWDQNGAQTTAFEAFGDLGLETGFTHDGARVLAGDWTGDIREWIVADGKLAFQLAPNPPTLDLASQAARERVVALETELTQASAAVVEAQKGVDEKEAALTTATQNKANAQAAAATTEATRLRAEKLLAARAAAAKSATDALAAAPDETQKAASAEVSALIEAERTAAEKDFGEKAALAKTAADQVAAAQADLDRLTAEKTPLDAALAEKSKLAQEATDRLAAAKAKADSLEAERIEDERRKTAEKTAKI